MNNQDLEQSVAAAWAKLGAMLNVAPLPETPDIELLLLDTARTAAINDRILVLGVTWLATYPDFVAKRRLAMLIQDQLEPDVQPVMGLMLEWTQSRSPRSARHFSEAIAYCKRAPNPGPLFAIDRRNPVLREFLRKTASPLSKRWGCWTEEFEPRPGLLRPIEWIAQQNPSLAIRALTGGDLVATIASAAQKTEISFESEAAMARHFHASRIAVRDAVLKLKMAGRASQTRRGKNHPIIISASPH